MKPIILLALLPKVNVSTVEDKVVISYSGKKNFYNFLKNLENKKHLINNIYKKIWNSKEEYKKFKSLF